MHNKPLPLGTLEDHIRKLKSINQIGSDGILLGARYGALDGKCDNCKIELQTYALVIMRPIFPRKFHTIHILCDKCRKIHTKEVKYYLYLNK